MLNQIKSAILCRTGIVVNSEAEAHQARAVANANGFDCPRIKVRALSWE